MPKTPCGADSPKEQTGEQAPNGPRTSSSDKQIITADALLQPSSRAVPVTPHHSSDPFDGLRRIKTETPLAALLNRVSPGSRDSPAVDRRGSDGI